MKTSEAKQLAAQWVALNLEQWPGLRSAHLVGGITSMADDADFPASKDVDIHLIFDPGSPALEQHGPFANIVEESFARLSIEAGIKSTADYANAATVLSNPEIAYHLTVDSILYDPLGEMAALSKEVNASYSKRHWVDARLWHERRGHQETLAMRELVGQFVGPSGEISMLGYSTTFLAGALSVAGLQPPRIGGRLFVTIREYLAAENRLDLYEQCLETLGIATMTRDESQRLLDEAAHLFDRAVPARRTPHPFQHKLHAHLRPYFVDSCQGMIDEGFPRESAGWITPFFLAATDVLIIDGPESDRAGYRAQQDALLLRLGMDKVVTRDEKFADAAVIATEVFAICEAMIDANPAVTLN